MNSKAYPRYKPSGIEWLGDVPEHWDVKRARYMLRMNPSKQEIRRLDPDTELEFVSMDAVSNEGFIRSKCRLYIFRRRRCQLRKNHPMF